MKRLVLPLFTFLVAVSLMLVDTPMVLTYSSGSIPGDKTGAPGAEVGCGTSNCHGTASLSGSGSATLSMETDSYVPGEVYVITVSTNDAGATLYGFQATVLEGAASDVNSSTNSPSQGGGFVAPSGMKTNSSGGRDFISHEFTSNTTGTWFFEWVAPNSDIGPVTFYLAALAANGNGNKTGDFVYFDVLELSPATFVDCIEFGESIVPAEPLCSNQNFVDMGIASTAELPEGITSVYYYYGEDPEFDPYALEGDILISGIAGYNIPNTTCAPITYTIKAALIAHNTGVVADGPPANTECRPAPIVGEITVYPDLGEPTIEDLGCAITVIAACDDFTVQGESGTATFNFEPGQAGVLDLEISNGLEGCQQILEIPFSCSEEICMASAGVIDAIEEYTCLEDGLTISTTGANEDGDFGLWYLLTDATFTILDINQSGEFTPEVGYIIPHAFSASNDELEVIELSFFIGGNASDLIASFDCFDLQTLAGNTVVVDAITFTANEICDEETGQVSLEILASGGAPEIDGSEYSVDGAAFGFGQSATLLIGDVGTDYSFSITDDAVCVSASVEGTAGDCMTGLNTINDDFVINIRANSIGFGYSIESSETGQVELQIFNSSGQLMGSKSTYVGSDSLRENWTIDLAPGIYLLRYKLGEQINTTRFLSF